MKKLTLVLLYLMILDNSYSQSIIKDSTMRLEGVLGDKITQQLWDQLDPKKVPDCYHKIFSVKFKIDDNGLVRDIKISGNMSEKVVIDIVTNAIKSSENLWDIEKCKKYNPTMNFLLPIDLNIFKPACNLSYDDENVLEARYDFGAMIKYEPNDKLRCLFCPVKEKFVGMVLNPIFVNNGKF
jgi:hypothetical protein